MAKHSVKSWTYLYEAIINGQKKHDVRYVNERDYQVGDLLELNEFDQVLQQYTGRKTMARITYITSEKNHCALSPHGLTQDIASYQSN